MEQSEWNQNSREFGAWGEEAARAYLERVGFEVLYQNVYTEYGEIDLVARKDGRLHMVEVKTRRTRAFGFPEESLTERKHQLMQDSAQAFMQANPDLGADFQIDVIAVQVMPDKTYEVTYFENAV